MLVVLITMSKENTDSQPSRRSFLIKELQCLPEILERRSHRSFPQAFVAHNSPLPAYFVHLSAPTRWKNTARNHKNKTSKLSLPSAITNNLLLSFQNATQRGRAIRISQFVPLIIHFQGIKNGHYVGFKEKLKPREQIVQLSQLICGEKLCVKVLNCKGQLHQREERNAEGNF